MSVDSNFNFLCRCPHGAGPPPPSTCVHLSLTPPSPLRVDVINGWPLSTFPPSMFSDVNAILNEIHCCIPKDVAVREHYPIVTFS